MIDFFKGTVTPRDWAFVAVVLCAAALVVVGVYFGLLDPQAKQLDQVNAQLAERQKDLAEALKIQENFDALQAEAQEMELLVSEFQKRLPDEREVNQLINKFEQLGNDVGLRVSVKPLDTQRDDRKETIPYEATVDGTFHQIAAFINLLERDERYLKVSDLDIGEEEAGISQGKFRLSTFRFIEQPAQSATPAPAAVR